MNWKVRFCFGSNYGPLPKCGKISQIWFKKPFSYLLPMPKSLEAALGFVTAKGSIL